MKYEDVERLIEKTGRKNPWDVREASDLFLPVFNVKQSWHHAANSELTAGQDRVHTADVAEAARSYMTLDWLQDETLDWLLADAMAFGEVNATFKSLSPNRFYYDRERLIAWRLVLSIIFRLILWGAWLLLFVMLFSEERVWSFVLVGITGIYQFPKIRRQSKIALMLNSMTAVYDGLDAVPPSWRNVYAMMEKSRDLGAKWPTQMYRLVERRLGA